MKKVQAERVAKHVKRLIKKLGKGYDAYADHAKVSVRESDCSKGWYGVYVNTDATALDFLYNNAGYYVDAAEAKEFGIKQGNTGGHRARLENELSKAMGWKDGDHYFENEGYGVMYIY